MNQIKSSSIYIQVAVAALLYNLLHMFAWELPHSNKARLEDKCYWGCLYYFNFNREYYPYILEKKNRANVGNDTCSLGDISSMVFSLYHLGL